MRPPKIGVVGPCAAGKSTLIAGLARHDIRATHIAQEHSYAPAMWERISKPDLLIYLDASYPVTLKRKGLNWTESEYQEQTRRLSHAREHTDFYIDTDQLSAEQVLQTVLNFLSAQRI